ncbi:DUF1725 domain-containing protein [bacterium]|nr:DUF1725 domain-containing protein [Candidatus Neomarinimicrobiota bacterium]MBU4443837.1 DUF1725 domain-containing protein [bacterium]
MLFHGTWNDLETII